MTTPSPGWFAEVLATLVDRRDLSPDTMRALVRNLMSGHCDEVEMAAPLIALRMKGETADELAAAAAVLREQMVPLGLDRTDVLDTCGMGGDGAHTFNISTAVAIVVAGAGVPVVKHGNRAVSSSSGSADVLAALGIHAQADPAWARRCLAETGLAFCFAQHFHPAVKQVAALRQRLRVRTLFNLLGPLANPARAEFQLLGVARATLLDPLAGALAQLGTRRAILVCGADGLDEVSLSAATLVRDVCAGKVTSLEWTPEDFGLARCALADLRADGPESSAVIIRSVLEPSDSPPARIVLANAGAALMAAERAGTPAEGVKLARAAVAGGRARHVLERLVAISLSSPT